jgi:LDH2 family malate/lactate/ureidoglycolate dehydrogenase
MAIKPDLFMPLSDFKERMSYLYNKVISSDRMGGVDRIYFPGELEILQQEVSVAWVWSSQYLMGYQAREKSGIPWTQEEIDALNAEADLVGAPHLVVS